MKTKLYQGKALEKQELWREMTIDSPSCLWIVCEAMIERGKREVEKNKKKGVANDQKRGNK